MGRQYHRTSVIVPVLDDTRALESILKQLRELSGTLEVVVADSGEGEVNRKTCREYGAVWLPSPRGRGIQMNRGARVSRGEILWFLHADSTIHPEALHAIEVSMSDSDTAGGAFRFRLHQRHWYAAFLDMGVRLRSTILKLPYGDQAYFVRRSVFEAMGGFKNSPFLEDVDFIRRLCGYGEVKVLSTPIGVSSRRWEREGFFYTTVRNWCVTILFFLGGSPDRLVKWYEPEFKRAVKPGERIEKNYRFETMKLRKME